MDSNQKYRYRQIDEKIKKIDRWEVPKRLLDLYAG